MRSNRFARSAHAKARIEGRLTNLFPNRFEVQVRSRIGDYRSWMQTKGQQTSARLALARSELLSERDGEEHVGGLRLPVGAEVGVSLATLEEERR